MVNHGVHDSDPSQQDDPLSAALARLFTARWRTGHCQPDKVLSGPGGGCALYVPLDGDLEVRWQVDRAASSAGHSVDHSVRGMESIDRGRMVLITTRDPHDVHVNRSNAGFLYGQLDSPYASDLFLETLVGPQKILDIHNSPQLSKCATLIAMIGEELQRQSPGWHAMVNRLVLSLVIQSLRSVAIQAANRGPLEGDSRTHWMLAALDPVLGPVMRKIHMEPEREWTVPLLARECRMSRSAFSLRFRQLVGKPPLHYLTEYRMQRACDLLLNTQLNLVEISRRVGYDSATSFGNAFKRTVGHSPIAYRRTSSRLQAAS